MADAMNWHLVWTVGVGIVGLFTGLGLRAFGLGRSAGRIEADLAEIRGDLVELRQKDEIKSAANAGAVALFKEQLHALETKVAETYATKTDFGSLERRMESGLERVDRKLDALSDQMRSMPGELAALVQRA